MQVSSAQNSGSRSMIRLPLDNLPAAPEDRVACQWGHTPDCRDAICLECSYRGLQRASLI